MRGRSWAAIGGVFLSLALCSTASAQFSPGSRSLGDVYCRTLGNGGYDAQHYDVSDQLRPRAHFIDVERDAHRALDAGAVGVLARLLVDVLHRLERVTVNGAAATWTRDEDAGHLSSTSSSSRRPPGSRTTRRSRSWSTTRHAAQLRRPGRLVRGLHAHDVRRRGAFVVNEPIGAMAWFPNNNHPRDKATYDFHLTAPDAYSTRRQRRAGVDTVDNAQRHDDLELEARPTRWRATCRRRRSASSTTASYVGADGQGHERRSR